MGVSKASIGCYLAVVLLGPLAWGQGLSFQEEGNLLRVQNRWVRCEINVAKGAKVSSFVLRSSGREWTYGGPNSGLFIDHLWQQPHPGELQNAPYEYKVLERTPQKVVLAFWRSIRSERDDNISHVKVEKIMTFRGDTPAVKAVVILSNPSDTYKRPGFWQQHCFSVGGDRENVFHFRPSTVGIKVATNERMGNRWRRRGEDFVKDAVAGWTGTADAETKEGAVFLMDYNYLKWLYNCIPCWTVEYFYDRVSIRPGGSWQTEQYFIPTRGYEGFSYADGHVLADVRGMGDRLVLKFGSSVEVKRDVKITVETLQFADGKPLFRKELTAQILGFEPQEKEVILPELADRACLVKVTFKGRDWTSSFEKFLAPGVSPFEVVPSRVAYKIAKPHKRKTYTFPDQPPPLPEKLSVLFLKGIHVGAYRIEDAISLVEGAAVKKSYYTANVYGNRVDYLPSSPKEMFKYNLVIVGNVDYEALGTDFSAYLGYFVRHGGALLVLGGSRAFGRGQYNGTGFEALLPVESGQTFDLLPAEKSCVLNPVGGITWLAGLDWSRRPSVFWFHRPASIRDGATVVIRAGESPFLVERALGKGKVAVLLGTVLGGEKGQLPFWEWKDWPKLLSRIFAHLTGA